MRTSLQFLIQHSGTLRQRGGVHDDDYGRDRNSIDRRGVRDVRVHNIHGHAHARDDNDELHHEPFREQYHGRGDDAHGGDRGGDHIRDMLRFPIL